MKEQLLTLINQIIGTFNGQEFEDKYSFNKFEDGIWYTKNKTGGRYEEMTYKNMDSSDLVSEIEVLMEGINKVYPHAEIKMLLVGVDVDI